MSDDDDKKPLVTPPTCRSDPVEPEKVTAPVTAPPRAMTPWETVGMDEATWKNLEIPEFLQRTSQERLGHAPAPAPIAAVSGGDKSGSRLSAPAGVTGSFEHFRVDPAEIAQKIRAEADRQWREWMPTKTDRKRPTMRTLIKRVRRQYYP